MDVQRAFRRLWSQERGGVEVFVLEMAPNGDRRRHFRILVRLEDGAWPDYPAGTYAVGRCSADGTWEPDPSRNVLIDSISWLPEYLEELQRLIIVHRVMGS